MPELPETETIARDLDALVRGAVILRTEVIRGDVLREVDEKSFVAQINGARIERVWRRAKLVVIDIRGTANSAAADERSSISHIVVQPRFTGGLLIENAATDSNSLASAALTHITISFHLADGRRLHYRDIRRLGTVTPMSSSRFDEYSGALGPEPLDPEFSIADVSALVRSSSRPIKAVLMDQRALAGVGNIYANEALWRAGIDPSRTANSISEAEAAALHTALQGVLRASIEARGTSFRDYRDARGERGRFVEQLAAYGRAGLPCTRCSHRLVGTHAIDGRSTVFCAYCQR